MIEIKLTLDIILILIILLTGRRVDVILYKIKPPDLMYTYFNDDVYEYDEYCASILQLYV